MINKLGFYISNQYDPYINIATEKHLFDTVEKDCVILYLWQNDKTVVIGKNQNPWTECQCSLLEQDGGRVARRLSGGGAVYHDLGNLNFTFISATENYDLSRQMQVVKYACSLAGIDTQISGRNDILAGDKKFSGNAFYNSKGKSYHHGTILINTNMQKMSTYLTPSRAKLESKGVKSVKSRTVNLQELSATLTCDKMREYMLTSFDKVYGLSASLCQNLDTDEILKLSNTYGSWEYIYGTPIPFTFSCDGSFSWGQITLQIQVGNGIINHIKAYTDSMDWALSELIESALLNCRFDFISMKKALTKSLPDNLAKDIVELLKNQDI